MKANDVAIGYVKFADITGGKIRPILILNEDEQEIGFFVITTKYENKAAAIKRQ